MHRYCLYLQQIESNSKMVEEFSNGLATIFKQNILAQKTDELLLEVDDMLTRLDEFETLLLNLKVAKVVNEDLPALLSFSEHIKQMSQKSKDLELYALAIKNSVDNAERSTKAAEDALLPKEYSLRNFIFKQF